MKNSTPIFPNFHLQTLRRSPRTKQQLLANQLEQLKTKSINQLGELFQEYIDEGLLKPSNSGTNSRQRIYSKSNTFWAFLSQVLNADSGCQEVVKKMQAYAALKGLPLPSSSTASYCQARGRLQLEELESIHHYTASQLDEVSPHSGVFGRRVVVVDGTGLSMPDTPENQEVWPQQKIQKPGCGFPTLKLTACFSLHSGALLSYATGCKHDHELNLFRDQWNILKREDIVLGDKGFCNYRDLATLHAKQIDSVMAMRKKHPIKESQALRKLGDNDYLVSWKRPVRIASFTPEEWTALPRQIRLRQIKIEVNTPGFRTQSIYLVTTLLDPEAYPASVLRDLYFQRWDVELFFRDIKITMGMDILRCKNPAMIEKELLMHVIAYNCVRRLMIEAADEAGIPVRNISFKGSVQALRNWEPHLNQLRLSKKEKFRLTSELYASMTNKPLFIRPDRSEPRVRKRRAKNYHLLTRPRDEMIVPKNRNRNWKNKGKKVLS